MGYVAIVISEGSREKLLQLVKPAFPDVIAHHVTVEFGIPKPDTGLGDSTTVRVVGYVVEEGLEAVVVEVNGRLDRPDGKTYHITLSLDREKGKKPVDSNALIERDGFERIIPFTLKGTYEYLN
jgi:hypothetical protein